MIGVIANIFFTLAHHFFYSYFFAVVLLFFAVFCYLSCYFMVDTGLLFFCGYNLLFVTYLTSYFWLLFCLALLLCFLGSFEIMTYV